MVRHRSCVPCIATSDDCSNAPDQPVQGRRSMPNVTSEPLAVPIDRAVMLSGMSRSAIYRELGAGNLRASKQGARTLVLVDSIKGLMPDLQRDWDVVRTVDWIAFRELSPVVIQHRKQQENTAPVMAMLQARACGNPRAWKPEPKTLVVSAWRTPGAGATVDAGGGAVCFRDAGASSFEQSEMACLAGRRRT